MSSLTVTGPALIYVGTGPASFPPNPLQKTILFLGTCERPPTYRVRRGWVPVFNDLAGTQIPFDLLYSSQEAFTMLDLNWINQPALTAIESMPNQSGTPGINTTQGDIGTLMVAEGYAFPLYVRYPYASKPAMVAAGMPAGIVFPNTVLEGPDDNSIGTTNRKKRLIFHSIPGILQINGNPNFILSSPMTTAQANSLPAVA